MTSWKPISEEEFSELFKSQYAQLDAQARRLIEPYLRPFWRASIKRSEEMGDEHVFVVAQKQNGILYYDDVEDGFNISTVDENGRILTPGGSQATLEEAILLWFPKVDSPVGG
ncbi:MAG TPA: hypothetical protein VFF38_03185 [Microvirga sp.]|nr:hypothetical protein [Microvirga sp.]